MHDRLQGRQAGGRRRRRAAIALAKGERKETGQTVKDPEGNRDVPAVLLTPQAIYKENVKDVIADGFVTKEEVCTGNFAELCTKAGIS